MMGFRGRADHESRYREDKETGSQQEVPPGRLLHVLPALQYGAHFDIRALPGSTIKCAAVVHGDEAKGFAHAAGGRGEAVRLAAAMDRP